MTAVFPTNALELLQSCIKPSILIHRNTATVDNFGEDLWSLGSCMLRCLVLHWCICSCVACIAGANMQNLRVAIIITVIYGVCYNVCPCGMPVRAAHFSLTSPSRLEEWPMHTDALRTRLLDWMALGLPRELIVIYSLPKGARQPVSVA